MHYVRWKSWIRRSRSPSGLRVHRIHRGTVVCLPGHCARHRLQTATHFFNRYTAILCGCVETVGTGTRYVSRNTVDTSTRYVSRNTVGTRTRHMPCNTAPRQVYFPLVVARLSM